jgi:GNAT superfamily N-acetyltransferase
MGAPTSRSLAPASRPAAAPGLACRPVAGLVDGVPGGSVRLYPLGSPGRWKGDRLAVLPEHRRAGLGAPLVRFAVAEAGARGGQEMEAYIQPANVAFFEWLGWRRVGGIVAYAGTGHQRMVIPLASRGDRPSAPG